MKRLIPIVLLATTVTGCATSQMKSTPFYSGSERVYTGRVEDRVNLWPFAYYREPALSVLWPIFSLTDDHMAVRPIYSQYKQTGRPGDYDEFNFLWPFCQFDTKHDEHRIFPLFWGDKHVDLFPLVWWRFDKSFTFFPLAWWKKDRYCNVFPLWWSDNSHKLFLPFYFQDENTLAVIPFYGSDTHVDSFSQWIGPYGRYRNEKHPEQNYDWCFPFYCRDATSFETPLFGWDRNDRSSWAFPFYYKDHESFVSLLWCWDWGDNSDTYVVPPLLSWVETSSRGDKTMRFLLGLGGVNTTGGGEVDCSWAFPLYYNDDNAFVSLPFAHVKDDYTYVTPLFGVTHEEHKKGGWLWPLFGWKSDDRMEAVEAMLNAPTLDAKVRLEKHEREWDGKKYQWHTVKGVDYYVSDSSWRLSGLSTSDRWISWSASDDGKTVMAEDNSDFGNIFAYMSDYNRTVKFDYTTKKKISDKENGESGLFCNLLWHSKHEASKGHEYDMKSILWRFWHYEKLNGDVTVDSFPFFTYDSKTNGYSKTSLCWRLFRNEYDPKTDKRSVDFLFIPVWR